MSQKQQTHSTNTLTTCSQHVPKATCHHHLPTLPSHWCAWTKSSSLLPFTNTGHRKKTHKKWNFSSTHLPLTLNPPRRILAHLDMHHSHSILIVGWKEKLQCGPNLHSFTVPNQTSFSPTSTWPRVTSWDLQIHINTPSNLKHTRKVQQQGRH